MEALQGWFERVPGLLPALAALSVVTFVGTLLAVPWLIARLPADYFVRAARPATGGGLLRWLRLARQVVLNILGGLLILAGLAMLVLPGQGLLTILVGVSMTSLPGKRWLLVRLLSVPEVRRAVSWMRRRAGRPELLLPPLD